VGTRSNACEKGEQVCLRIRANDVGATDSHSQNVTDLIREQTPSRFCIAWICTAFFVDDCLEQGLDVACQTRQLHR